MSRRFLKLAASAALAAGMVVTGASIAQAAEPPRYSYMGGWAVGAKSNPWVDDNSTTAATRVYLSGVVLYVPYTNVTYTASTVQLQLQYKNVFGIWAADGNQTAAPGTYHNWGRKGAADYRFQYNGSSSGGTFYGATSGVNIIADVATIYW